MGIYIKGFRKPTYCQECPLTFDYDCMIQHEQRDSLIDQYKHCPLIEVKTPRGRLIDADDLIIGLELHAEAHPSDSIVRIEVESTIGAITDEPTVIEAEVG